MKAGDQGDLKYVFFWRKSRGQGQGGAGKEGMLGGRNSICTGFEKKEKESNKKMQ